MIIWLHFEMEVFKGYVKKGKNHDKGDESYERVFEK
jgi:hypothetical protein